MTSLRMLTPGLFFSLAAIGLSQSIPSARPFEVASVKQHNATGGRIGLSTSGVRLHAEAKTLVSLVMYAYDLPSYRVPYTKAVEPIEDVFYDIEAKAEDGPEPSTDEFREMMQRLLADRFKLQFHYDTREIPVYALNIRKKGPKLKEGLPGRDASPHFTPNGRNYELTMASASMDDIVRAIENTLLDRPVIDKTNLPGKYRVTMTYTPNTPSNRKSPEPDDISIFDAVHQLGLTLEPRRMPVKVLVIDYVERPTAN